MVSTLAIALLIALIAVAATGASAVDSQSDEVLFEVEIVDTNEPVAEGETLEITAEITNAGDVEDSQQIHLKNADHEILDSIAGPPVTLEPGETEQVTLTWDLEKGDAGTHELRIASNYDADELSVDVQEGVFFDVSINETNAPITAGERLNVSVDVTSTEDATETADVWIELDGTIADSRTLQLEPGETERIEFSWESTQSDAGEHTLSAVTNGDRDSTTISAEAASTSSNTGWTVPPNVVERDITEFDGSDSTSVPGSDVERITFENETVSGQVIVSRLRDVPAEAEPLDDLVGVYRIDVPDVAAEYTATVEFTLSAESFGDSGTDSVRVLLWTGDEWHTLDTETETIDDEVTVTAKTHGFSLFAVTTGNETDEPMSEANESSTETPETPTNSETDTETSTPESETGTPNSEPTAESSDEEVPGFGLGIAFLALLTTALLGKRRLRDT